MKIDTNATETAAAPEGQALQPMPGSSDASSPGRTEQATVSPEELDALKAKAELATQHWDRLLRVSADFENFKKRATRERQDAIKYGNEALLQKLIPVLDNFEMALGALATAQNPAAQSLQAGIAMIHQQLKAVMAEAGLHEVDASGKVFDPTLHEAVAQEETDEMPEGQVVRQVRKGYRLQERLLRPASVVVAKAPGQEQEI